MENKSRTETEDITSLTEDQFLVDLLLGTLQAGEDASPEKRPLQLLSIRELLDRSRTRRMLERLQQVLGPGDDSDQSPPAPLRYIAQSVALLGPEGQAPSGMVAIPTQRLRRA